MQTPRPASYLLNGDFYWAPRKLGLTSLPCDSDAGSNVRQVPKGISVGGAWLWAWSQKTRKPRGSTSWFCESHSALSSEGPHDGSKALLSPSGNLNKGPCLFILPWAHKLCDGSWVQVSWVPRGSHFLSPSLSALISTGVVVPMF